MKPKGIRGILHGHDVWEPGHARDQVVSIDVGIVRRGFTIEDETIDYWGFVGLCITCEPDERPF